MREVKIKGLHHVAIHVRELDSAKEFYEDIFGLAPTKTPDNARENGIAWYELPDGRQLHLFERKESTETGRAHFALEVEDLDSWQKLLRDKEIATEEPTVDLYKAKRIFIRDPSGNLFELVEWLK